MSQYQQIYNELYPNLFSPLTVGEVKFKNRIFTAPAALSNTITAEGFLTPEGIIDYARKAQGGAALVTLNEGMFEVGHRNAHNDVQINIQDEKTFRTLPLFTDYVHLFGAKASLELIHCGQMSNPQLTDGQPMGPTARVMPDGTEVREMNEDDMEQVAESFAQAAQQAVRGGFDMITIHAGHGWLLTQILSPVENLRKDKYGGSLENRARLPIMILDRIRKAVGTDLLIEYRYSVDELVPGGYGVEEGCEFAKMIEDKVDLLHCSVGSLMRNPVNGGITHPTHFLANGCNAYLAEALKKSGVKKPVVAIGAINDPALAESIIAEGRADFVTMVRSFIAEPDWAEKARAGRAKDIRPCIKCLNCLSGAHSGRMQCSVNPEFGREQILAHFPAAKSSKKVVVVGGGPSGMQAAIEASERGHEVTLYEKSENLGGQLVYSEHVSFKENMMKYKNYLIRQVMNSDITVKLNTEAKPELVYLDKPDAVIVALGADPLKPPIPGIEKSNVVYAVDAFSHPDIVGKKVVIVGGGMVGCEMSVHMAQLGKEVVLVEMGDTLAPDGTRIERMHTIHFMDQLLEYYTGIKCTEIMDKGIKAIDENGKDRFFECDTIIIAVGMKAKKEESDTFEGVAFDVIPVGDCVKTGNLINATYTGYDAALRI